ncbi:sulfite oxidase [soil metagenome]
MNTTKRTYAAISGLLATIAALSVGELAAGLISSWYSPIQAVGDTVIEFTPRPMKQFAIDTFGTNDKLALIVGTLILTLAFGTVLGVIGRKRLPVAWAGIALFGLLGVAASVFQADVASSVPSVITVLVGVPLLTLMLRTAPAPATGATTAATETDVDEPATVGASTDTDRRRFLALSGGVAVGSMAAVGTGRALINQRSAALGDQRADIAGQIGQTEAAATAGDGEALRPLGVVEEPLAPLPSGIEFDIPGLEPFQTPDEDFYRIDIALAVPLIDPDSWTLRIHGMVDEELEFSYEDLLRRDDLIESDITLTCVSNEVGGDLMSSGRWTGVPLRTLLDEAGVQSGADQIVGRDGDNFTTGFPTETLDDGRDAMLALLLNGEPLSPERGFPARVIVPGLYGYVSATKWITEIEMTTFADFDQYWVDRGWDEVAPIKTQSRIDVPRPLQRVPMGEIALAGVAWAQRRGIERVEIRVDDGEWQDVELADELNIDTWRQWTFAWTPEAPGNYRMSVRATDKDGMVQGEERVPPFPNGAEGWMTLLVTVTE